MPGRVGEGDPARAVGQPGGAQLDGPLGGRLVVLDLQVEVELLRSLLSRPLRGDVSGHPLERDLLAVAGPQRDPVRHLPHDLPARELDVEVGQGLDVRRVERGQLQLSGDRHAPTLPPAPDNGAGGQPGAGTTEPGRPMATGRARTEKRRCDVFPRLGR